MLLDEREEGACARADAARAHRRPGRRRREAATDGRRSGACRPRRRSSTRASAPSRSIASSSTKHSRRRCCRRSRELGISQAKVNVNGGSIAIGHPLGATGARLVLTLAKELRRSNSSAMAWRRSASAQAWASPRSSNARLSLLALQRAQGSPRWSSGGLLEFELPARHKSVYQSGFGYARRPGRLAGEPRCAGLRFRGVTWPRKTSRTNSLLALGKGMYVAYWAAQCRMRRADRRARQADVCRAQCACNRFARLLRARGMQRGRYARAALPQLLRVRRDDDGDAPHRRAADADQLSSRRG